VGQQGGKEFIGLRAVVGTGGFKQRDGFGDGAALNGGCAMKNGFNHLLALNSPSFAHEQRVRFS